MEGDRLLLSKLFGPDQDFSAYEWQPFRPGVEIHRIYGGGSDEPAAALLRYAPGAQVPKHRHTGREHIIVLAGSQRDQHGQYAAGSCVISRSGTAHDVASDEGCVVLALWDRPVTFSE